MIKFVTPEEGKEIKIGEFYLGQLVHNHASNEDTQIIGIDFNDSELCYAVTYHDDTDEMLREFNDDITILEGCGDTYYYDWASEGELSSLETKEFKPETPTRGQRASISPLDDLMPISEGKTIIKALKQIIPKPHTPQLSFQRDVEYDCVKYITIDNHTTLCINEISGDVGISYLHPDDTFNLEIAKALAFYRCEHKATSESLRKDSKRKVF